MRLLNVCTFLLEEFIDEAAPPYAILSHTWGRDDEEVSFRDIIERKYQPYGGFPTHAKLHGCCQQAVQDGYEYIWVDTCCIDKTNSVELQEAINSMFRYYSGAQMCYAYLSDVPDDDSPQDPTSKFPSSRWFTRGWTLQELLAPENLRFYNSNWRCLGTKGDLCSSIEKITGIPREFLLYIRELRTASVAQRMSWAAGRVTKRSEDIAYCLLGIFGVTMPTILGEGGYRAFRRLQEEIMKNAKDDSIFAWGLLAQGTSEETVPGGLLAAAPSDFASCGRIICREESDSTNPELFAGRLRLSLPIYTTSDERKYGLLTCSQEDEPNVIVGIPLAPASIKEASTSNEHIRPHGHYSLLFSRKFAAISPIQSIQIRIDNQNRPASITSPQSLFLIQTPIETCVDLIDVEPRSCWRKERALIDVSSQLDGNTMTRVFARFRHKDVGTSDFIVTLELEARTPLPQVQCSTMVSSRNTTLEDVARGFEAFRRKALGTQLVNNGVLSLSIAVALASTYFVVRLTVVSELPIKTVDATKELRLAGLAKKVEKALKIDRKIFLEEKGLINKKLMVQACIVEAKRKLH